MSCGVLRFPLPPFCTLKVTGKQRARMADLSLLLDIVLKTSSQTIKKEFVVCGILNQLQQAIGRNFSREYRCEAPVWTEGWDG